MSKRLQVGKNDDRKRLDNVVRKLLPDCGLGKIYKYIRKGDIRLNDQKAAPGQRVKCGDMVNLAFDIATKGRDNRTLTKQETVRLKSLILLENSDLIAINKPAGMLTTGEKSLDTLIKMYLSEKEVSSLAFRPGPVHRLDRNTSGITIFAVSIMTARLFSEALRSGKIEKYYFCLLDGEIVASCTWRDRLIRISDLKKTVTTDEDCGKLAVTEVYPIISGTDCTFALCVPRTGRTHQIRAQASAHGHPLTGDRKYGGSRTLSHYMLHAACIQLKKGYRERLVVGSNQFDISLPTAPIPADSERLLSVFFGEDAGEKAFKLLDNLLRRLPMKE